MFKMRMIRLVLIVILAITLLGLLRFRLWVTEESYVSDDIIHVGPNKSGTRDTIVKNQQSILKMLKK